MIIYFYGKEEILKDRNRETLFFSHQERPVASISTSNTEQLGLDNLTCGQTDQRN